MRRNFIDDPNRPTCPICNRPAGRCDVGSTGTIFYRCKRCGVRGTSQTFAENAARVVPKEVENVERQERDWFEDPEPVDGDRLCRICEQRLATSSGICRPCARILSHSRRIARQLSPERKRKMARAAARSFKRGEDLRVRLLTTSSLVMQGENDGTK